MKREPIKIRRDWDPAKLDNLVLAEVHLADGYVYPDSGLLLMKDAEAAAQAGNDTGDRATIRNIAKVFLQRSKMVTPADQADYLLGMDYQPR